MKRDSTLYLSDIIENMDDAAKFLGALRFEDFVKDKKTTNAVVRSIEIIGEATKHISEEIRSKRPDVPWKNMAGMRDRCIHDYLAIDFEMVWNVVKNDVPRIRPLVQSLLAELGRLEKK
jgi:uncharacterized protein with HEPN domain